MRKSVGDGKCRCIFAQTHPEFRGLYLGLLYPKILQNLPQRAKILFNELRFFFNELNLNDFG